MVPEPRYSSNMLRGLYASVAPRATRVISRTCTAAVSTSNFSNPAVPRAATRIVLSPHRRTSVAIIEDLVLQRLFRCIPSRCFSSKDQSEEKREYDNEAETGGAGLEGDDETPTWEGLTEEEAQAAVRYSSLHVNKIVCRCTDCVDC